MRLRRFSTKAFAIGSELLCFGFGHAVAAEVRVEALGPIEARGIILFRFQADDMAAANVVQLFFADAGTADMEKSNFPASGKPLILRSVDTTRGVNTVVPVVATFGLIPGEFLFPKPATLALEWRFREQGNAGGEHRVSQTIVVRQPRPSDNSFLRALGDVENWSRIFARDELAGFPDDLRRTILDTNASDTRALFVIRELLRAADAAEPGYVIRRGGGIERAELLVSWLEPLVGQFADSTYAPYTSLFCAKCLLASFELENRREGAGVISPTMKSNANYTRAESLLRFSVEHGDAYVRPRAYFAMSHLYALSASWPEAFQALVDSEQSGATDSIAENVNKLRSSLERAKRKHESSSP